MHTDLAAGISGGNHERHTKKIFSGRGDFQRGAIGDEQEPAGASGEVHANATAREQPRWQTSDGHTLAYGDAGRRGLAARDGWQRKGLSPRGGAGEEKNRSLQND